MEEYLKIGVIVKPQGVRGEVKVSPLTDDLSRFSLLIGKTVRVGDGFLRVEKARAGGADIFIKFEETIDRNDAETLRGKFISVKRADAVALKKDEFFIADLIGLTLMTDGGEKIGVISEITPAKTDIFTVETADGKVLRFPFLKTLQPKADYSAGTFTVNEKRLWEIACYEN